MAYSEFKWPDGFLSGSSRTSLPSKQDSDALLDLRDRLPYPLNLHLNSVFQFFFVPLKHLIDLNGPTIKKNAIPTIWFSGYREMQALFPVDFKYWCFSGKKGIYTVLRALALIRLYCKFFSYVKLLRLKREETRVCDVTNILLIRRPTHLSAYSNPFYNEVVENSTKVLFFDPSRKLREDEVFAPLSLRIIMKALYDCSSAICKALATNCRAEISNIQLDLRRANVEACFHFETFLYAEQLRRLSTFNDQNTITSFEQVSSYAEIEKIIFPKDNLRHIQFGIIPYYPYPTIGLGSTFCIRSNRVLHEYCENFPERRFEKINLSKSFFAAVQYDVQSDLSLIFATQPYRKKQEREILTKLNNAGISNDIRVKYHPREQELYSGFSAVKDVFSMKNSVVITRTSSLTVELFARGIPYACFIDQKDLDLDQGEVSRIDSPVAFSNLDELILSLKNIEAYVQQFTEWRNKKLDDYLNV